MTLQADRSTYLCHCGRPLHYTDQAVHNVVQALVDQLGPDVAVSIGNRTWLVARHYIALHGIKGSELPTLGFPEVQ